MSAQPPTKSSTSGLPTRRAALAGLATALTPLAAVAQAAKVAPQPINRDFTVIEVGPGKRFASLTAAGVFMTPSWVNAGTPERLSRIGYRVIIHPGPPGYYVNDAGSHSRRWPSMQGWPAYEGNLIGPTIIEGAPGKPPPVLETDGYGDGVLYYQTGLFSTGSYDATFRRLVFRGFRRRDGYGNYAAIRLGQRFGDIPMQGTVTLEDCEIMGCDDALLGGAKGQKVVLRRCYIHHNGNETGLAHNIYIGEVDSLLVEDTLSTRCAIGHLLKSRAARTTIRNSRLIGNGGSESACLDVPDAGVLEIDGLVTEKSPNSDASWIIHYSGENQDNGGVPFHNPSSIRINNLTMISPGALNKKNKGSVVGFANASGAGEAASGKGSRFILPQPSNVRAFNMTQNAAGLPCQILTAKPDLDLSSPVRL